MHLHFNVLKKNDGYRSTSMLFVHDTAEIFCHSISPELAQNLISKVEKLGKEEEPRKNL